MNILFIKHFLIGFMVSEIHSVRILALSVLGYFPLGKLPTSESVTMVSYAYTNLRNYNFLGN